MKEVIKSHANKATDVIATDAIEGEFIGRPTPLTIEQHEQRIRADMDRQIAVQKQAQTPSYGLGSGGFGGTF